MGFMAPYDSLENMKNCMLMGIPTGCFFCTPPSPVEVVFIRQDIPKGKVAPYIDTPIVAEGILKLWKKRSNEPAHKSFIFVLDQAKVTKFDLKKQREILGIKKKE